VVCDARESKAACCSATATNTIRVLDLQDSKVFRPEVIARGGKSMFPYMIDPNTGTEMYESDDIISYMAKTYGDGTVPLQLRLGPVTAITAGLAGLPRSAAPSCKAVVLLYERRFFVVLLALQCAECKRDHETVQNLATACFTSTCCNGFAGRECITGIAHAL
jgi:hypothetical protein